MAAAAAEQGLGPAGCARTGEGEAEAAAAQRGMAAAAAAAEPAEEMAPARGLP